MPLPHICSENVFCVWIRWLDARHVDVVAPQMFDHAGREDLFAARRDGRHEEARVRVAGLRGERAAVVREAAAICAVVLEDGSLGRIIRRVRNRTHNRSKIMSNLMRNDLPLGPSTRANGGTANHTGGTSRSLLVAHSPQPRHANLGTRRAARHEVPQATRVGHAVQVVTLLPSPGGEEREALVERYRAAGYVPWVGGITCGAAAGRSIVSQICFLSGMYVGGRNVL
jgi:hypothetical protein